MTPKTGVITAKTQLCYQRNKLCFKIYSYRQQLFKIVIIFHNITVLLYFYSNKVALVSIGGIFKNI